MRSSVRTSRYSAFGISRCATWPGRRGCTRSLPGDTRGTKPRGLCITALRRQGRLKQGIELVSFFESERNQLNQCLSVPAEIKNLVSSMTYNDLVSNI